MRVRLGSDAYRPLFFTAGNQPTQAAYGLTPDDVADAFVVSVLRSRRVLLAGSYYFESAPTRRLVEMFPAVWRSQAGHALFFLNTAYPSFKDHGLGKIAKSPKTFSPYADRDAVLARGGELDGIGLVGERADVDVSSAVVASWQNSCLSPEPGSIGWMLAAAYGPMASTAAQVCIEIAESRQYDFVWSAIEATIVDHPILGRLAVPLRRKLADLYSETMSTTLGAIETSPTLSAGAGLMSIRSVGQLGIFNEVLSACGIDVRRLREEQTLLRLLALDELDLIRRVDDLVVRSAVDAGHDASDYWRALRIVEANEASARLNHNQTAQLLRKTLRGLGVSPEQGFVKNLVRLETVYDNRLIAQFRSRAERVLSSGSSPAAAKPNRALLAAGRQNLLYAFADPSPRPFGRLGTAREQRALREALDAAGDRCRLDLVQAPAARIGDIRRLMLAHRPRYFHFSGHGSAVGTLELEGSAAPVTLRAGDLMRVLELTGLPDCVVLNACYSASAADDLGEAIPYTVLMSDRVHDDAALCFSRCFYAALAGGLGVEDAFELSRIELRAGGHDADVPLLFRHGKELGAVDRPPPASPR